MLQLQHSIAVPVRYQDQPRVWRSVTEVMSSVHFLMVSDSDEEVGQIGIPISHRQVIFLSQPPRDRLFILVQLPNVG